MWWTCTISSGIGISAVPAAGRPVDKLYEIESFPGLSTQCGQTPGGSAFAHGRRAMGVDDESAWYVVRAKPRAEALAAANLRVKNIEVYLPRLASGIARGGGSALRAPEPLFPGYLFARLVLARDYHVTAWTPGVANLLCVGEGQPAAIDDAVVESLRSRADGGEILKPRPALRVGARVEIRNGPFAGLLAVIDRPCTAAGRIQILLDLLRRQTRLDLPVSAVALL
jgi:transcriptional antiterminator RfaH